MNSTSRRDFLRTLPLIALAPTVPGFLARPARASTPEQDGRVLVVIQLDGGNDGINTVVPFGDEGYARNRKALRLATDRLIKVADGVGLHPAMGEAGKLLESGRLAIVPGVGYPNPNRSHFASMAIWQTARLDPEEHAGPGWLGRGLDATGRGRARRLFVGRGRSRPRSGGGGPSASSLERIDDLTLDPALAPARAVGRAGGDDLAAFVRRSTLDAYASADRLAELARDDDRLGPIPRRPAWPSGSSWSPGCSRGATPRGSTTRRRAATTPTPPSSNPHSACSASSRGRSRRSSTTWPPRSWPTGSLVLCFSEFGRRVAENGSAGTDHGTAGPVFLAGPGVKAGLLGAYPSLTDLDDGDLKPAVDFRRVYATLLEGWLGLPSGPALGGTFEPLPLLRG